MRTSDPSEYNFNWRLLFRTTMRGLTSGSFKACLRCPGWRVILTFCGYVVPARQTNTTKIRRIRLKGRMLRVFIAGTAGCREDQKLTAKRHRRTDTMMKLAGFYNHIRLDSGLVRRRSAGHKCPL